MDDLERWLRAAMQDAAQDPPPSLLSGIWRRRRRHLRRVGTAGVAAMAAVSIAVPSVLAASLTGSARPSRPAAGFTSPRGAAPGTELLKCGAYGDRGISGGQLSARWKSASIQAGPVWFIYARNGAWGSSKRLADGRLRDVGGPIVAVRNGTTVEIATPLADRSRFRFLTHGTVPGTYTLADGVPGLTVVPCPYQRVPPGMPEAYAAGLTLFYLPLGYVTNLTGCLPMEVATPPSWHVRWTAELPVHGRSCRT
ncbi:MAG: hypothetical protein ACLQFR_29180 [Streptosporangiaceae bacterium]